MKNKKIYKLIGGVIVILAIAIKMIHDYSFDHNEIVLLSFQRDKGTRIRIAQRDVRDQASSLLMFITECKMFPENDQDFVERYYSTQPYMGDGMPSSRDGAKPCERVPIKVYDGELGSEGILELSYFWIDPWQRPYQIRYDLDRGVLQIRSHGRYLWWPWDDIIGERSLSIPRTIENEMLEHCKKVPKNDMSCIFNRGWH